jgi:hypothetical protein
MVRTAGIIGTEKRIGRTLVAIPAAGLGFCSMLPTQRHLRKSIFNVRIVAQAGVPAAVAQHVLTETFEILWCCILTDWTARLTTRLVCCLLVGGASLVP